MQISHTLIDGASCNNIKVDDIESILLEITGYNDGPDWHWVCKTKTGYCYIVGGCDYTGWDCRSSMDRHDASSLEDAILLAPQDERRIFDDMRASGEYKRDSQNKY